MSARELIDAQTAFNRHAVDAAIGSTWTAALGGGAVYLFSMAKQSFEGGHYGDAFLQATGGVVALVGSVNTARSTVPSITHAIEEDRVITQYVSHSDPY